MTNGKVPMGPLRWPNMSGKEFLTVVAGLVAYEHLQRTDPAVIDGLLTGKGWSEDQIAALLDVKKARGYTEDALTAAQRQSGHCKGD